MKFFKPACAQEIEAPCPSSHKRNRLVILASLALWLLLVVTGLSILWSYENAPGMGAKPPNSWPAKSQIQRATDRATLVMLAHPHCPCTRASIGELALLMAQSQGRVTAYVLFLKPPGFSDEWEKTDLWQSAASIPGVNVLIDESGAEALRFHAATSGQTMLYDADGRLLFSGGITGSRGHAGDNAGRSSIVSLLNTGTAERAETFVFGCQLFGANSECQGASDERNEH
jgi:hypothetical protein